MEKIICCGFGHRLVLSNIEEELRSLLSHLIEEEHVDTFMIGAQGEFDAMFAKNVRILKKKYPTIKLLLVLPYLSSTINKEKEYYETAYDEIIIPAATEGKHYKSAATFKNRFMIDQSSMVVAYLRRDFGGAYTAVSYAKKTGKKIISL